MVKSLRQPSYENLEFLGDSFIYHVASEYISQTFPRMSPGRCSQMRERLLRNSNLSQYSLLYGLDKRADFPAEFFGEGRVGGTRAGNKERVKVLGDVFESYVGALVHCDPQGAQRTSNWLKKLWSMTLAKEIRDEYRQKAQSLSIPEQGSADGGGETLRNPKVRFAEAIGCKGVAIHYTDITGKGKADKHHGLPLFTVGLYVDAWGKTEHLGTGSGLSKKEAGSKAALQALENKKALKFYTDKRAAYLAAQTVQNGEEI